MGSRLRTAGARFALAIGLTACGGGGSDVVPEPVPSPTPSPSPSPSAGPAAIALPADFRINGIVEGRQDEARIVRLAGGAYVTAWTHRAAGGATQVRLRRFDESLRPSAPETTVADPGFQPGLAALPDGGFAVTWSSEAVTLAGVETRGHVQAFDADGTQRGAASITAPGDSIFTGRPAGLSGGGFVVASDSRSGTRGADVGAVQLFAADGTPRGGRMPVNADPADVSTHVSGTVASRAGTGFAVAWAVSGPGPASSIQLRLHDGDGTPLRPPVTVASDGDVRFPALATLPDGTLAVAWTRFDVVAGALAPTLWLARYDANGQELGRQAVRTGPADRPFAAALAALEDGGLVIAWSITTDSGAGTANRRTVAAQRFDASGAPAGDPVTIAQPSFPAAGLGAAEKPDVASAGGNRYLVAYGNYSAEADWDVAGAVR